MASSESAALESSESSVLSVKELMKNHKITVPESYLRLDQEPPNPLNGTHVPASIPTFDLESLLSKEDKEFQLEKLHAICKEWGIFQLVNHGVSSSLLAKLKHDMLEFYELPMEEKMKYKIKPDDVEGYGAVARSDGKLDWGDRVYMITNPIQRRKSHLLPELPSSLRKTLESYFLELQKLALKLLGLVMGKALNIESKEIEEIFEDGTQSVRMNYYPPCPKPEVVMGLTPHSDATAITILHQVNGVDGLEIKKDGVWIPARILPNALVVNVGDILEIMSNGVYRSVEHRATVNSVKERISIAFFVGPKFDAQVGPLTSLINPDNPPLFRRVLMEEYVKTFFSRKLNGKSHLEYMKIEIAEGS
ncbi:protein SRG1 [Citrus sinensis]|uniref:Protein SRG1 n=1 Tax=Citrus sinensis TaxID=2711 RepID=A0ACB8NHS4_CITSI|nr:protein SRG1 [Citrus sinensis]